MPPILRGDGVLLRDAGLAGEVLEDVRRLTSIGCSNFEITLLERYRVGQSYQTQHIIATAHPYKLIDWRHVGRVEGTDETRHA